MNYSSSLSRNTGILPLSRPAGIRPRDIGASWKLARQNRLRSLCYDEWARSRYAVPLPSPAPN